MNTVLIFISLRNFSNRVHGIAKLVFPYRKTLRRKKIEDSLFDSSQSTFSLRVKSINLVVGSLLTHKHFSCEKL